VRVMLVGDSVAFTLGQGLLSEESKFHITQENLAILGCGVAQGPIAWLDFQGQEEPEPVWWPCRVGPHHGLVPWEVAWRNWLPEVHPNVVVLLAGRWEVMDRLYLGQRTNILDPGFATYVRQQLERAVQIGTSTGARMVLMTAPCSFQGEQLDGAPFPEDDIHRIEAYNRIVRQVGSEFPSTVVVQDLFAMACPQGKYTTTLDGARLRGADGTHFATSPGTGADLLASRILPLWEQLGHLQEAIGGQLSTGPLPAHLSPP
jgi:hypothetical protein